MLRPILKAEDLKGGCSYLKMTLTSELTYVGLEVITPTKKPHLHRYEDELFDDAWFSSYRIQFLGDDYIFLDDSFSLQDANIIPNCYNNHSVWNNDMKTLQFLQKVCAYDNDALEQYLNILARFKRGHNYDEHVRKDEESIAA